MKRQWDYCDTCRTVVSDTPRIEAREQALREAAAIAQAIAEHHAGAETEIDWNCEGTATDIRLQIEKLIGA